MLTGMILANLGGSMFRPFFAIFLKQLGLEVDAIGLYFTLAAIFPLLFQVIGGWVSDRIGRLRSIAFGSMAGALSWVGILLAPAMAWPVAWFLAADALGAMTRSLVGPSFDAFVADQSGEQNRGRVYALVHAIFMVVGIAGPPLGGLIVERFGFPVLVRVGAGLYWSATILRVIMARRVAASPARAATPAGSGITRAGLGASLRDIFTLAAAGGVFLWIMIVDGALDIAGKLSEDLLPLYLKEIGRLTESRIGLLQGLSAVCMAAAMLPMGALADRRGERFPIMIGCVAVAGSVALFVFGRGIVAFAFAYAIFGASGACFGPAMQSLITKVVPQRLRGLAFGFLSTSLGAFSFFAPAVGGLLWKRFFPTLPFLVSGAICALAAIPVNLRYRLPPTPSAGGPARAAPDAPRDP
jgi:MFS family permease